jgi:hypothetical protein
MAGVTTCMPDQAKLDILAGVHEFVAAYGVGTAYKVGDRSTNAGNIYVLTAALTGTGLGVTAPTGTTTSSDNGGTWTYVELAPVYKLVLIKSGMAGTYGAASKYYSEITGNSDEVGNSGSYAAGGITLTGLAVAIAANHANADFADAQATAATISAAAGAVVNTSRGGKIVGLFDFGGTKNSSAGNFTAGITTGVIAIN